jgi:hypothetical protein
LNNNWNKVDIIKVVVFIMEPTGMTIILTVLIAMSFCAVLVMCINCLLGTCHGFCKPYFAGRDQTGGGGGHGSQSGSSSTSSNNGNHKRANLLEML